MNDELTLSGKRFVSSKRASEETGYTQDYIGQLARGGSIEAQRVGGLWYVALESLQAYRDAENRDEQKSESEEVPVVAHSVHNEFVSFDGKDYISASRAAELSGYHQDYVGQLARSGKVLSRQIGKRWYVERSGVLAHKEQKDALLAAVQAQSVGLARPEHPAAPSMPVLDRERSDAVLTYNPEPHVDLLPRIAPAPVRAPDLFDDADDELELEVEHQVPIRVSKKHDAVTRQAFMRRPRVRRKKHGMTSSIAAVTTAVLTVVVVLSFGLSLLDGGTKFADAVMPTQTHRAAFLGAAATAFDRYGAVMEQVLIPELVYVRKQ